MTDAVQDEKIQKVLARAGFGSRREMENWITQGRIKINGKTATLGDRAGADDSLVVGWGHRLASALATCRAAMCGAC